MAGLCACGETDLKKVVALRTLSQLGVMAVALTLPCKALCFFHLITHAMFKALLFICVGVAIHTVFGTQDARSYCGLTAALPWPSAFVCTATLALVGFPYLAGYYSKDSILEGLYNRGSGAVPLLFFLLGVGFTTTYRTKLVRRALRAPGSVAPACLNLGGSPAPIKLPLFRLATGAVLGGALLVSGFPAEVPVLAPADKLLPYALIAGGAAIGATQQYRPSLFMCRMWDLAPSFQYLACGRARGRVISVLDEGTGESLGGPGWLVLLLGRQLSLYPALTLGPLFVLPLVL